MKLKLFLGVFLPLILFFAFSPLAFAQTPPTIGANLDAYVPPTGSQCNINVPSQYSTIQAGINAANWGDTVCVGPGTYNEDLLINKTIKLSGSGVANSIIKGQNPWWPGAVRVTATEVIVEGFLIRGTGISNAIEIDVNNPTPNTIIRYNWIVAGNGGIALYVGRSQNLIQNNILEGNNSPYAARAFGGMSFLNNTFIGTVNPYGAADTGIYLVIVEGGNLIKQNIFNPTSGPDALLVGANNSVITENNFHGDNTPIKVAGYPGNNAQNNWWGDTDPSDNVGAGTDYSNYALTPFPEYPYNQPPIIRRLYSGTVAVGGTYTTSSYFLDVGSSSWTATVDYGDGSGIQPFALSGKDFSLSHVYQNIGTYTVTVSVTDDQNAIGTETATITVNSSGITVGANLNAYVPPAGSQCNINVPSQYSTIQAGVNAASAGNTVCVGAGTYNEDVVISKPLRLSGSGVSKSVIKGLPGWPGPILISASNVIVEGFLIHGSDYYDVVQLSEHDSDITLRYNWMVSGDRGDVIFTGGAQNNILVQNNIMEGNNSHHIAYVSPSNKVDFLNNTFIGTVNNLGGDTGIVADNRTSNGSFKQNVVNITGTMRGLVSTNVNSMVNENNFNSNTLIKVFGTLGPLIINAENNWWGDTNPSDNVTSIVDYTPFTLSPFPEYSINQAPVVGTITAPTTPIQVNTSVTASANFTDLNTLDTHTASWNWGDGIVTPGTVTESSGSVSDSHTYTAAGVYTITLTVTDNSGAIGTSIFQYVSVYNPTPQGLFTGNRIFSSSAGAYPQNPNLTGQVQFGVTSKYQDTLLIGKVSMNFRAANLEFDSTSLTVLVVSDGQATLRGTGTINGTGNYNLLVTGLDGTQDAIRFQIKDQSGTVVIYDSQPGAPDTDTPTTSAIGQIIIH